jgi:hypothetical protein
MSLKYQHDLNDLMFFSIDAITDVDQVPKN